MDYANETEMMFARRKAINSFKLNDTIKLFYVYEYNTPVGTGIKERIGAFFNDEKANDEDVIESATEIISEFEETKEDVKQKDISMYYALLAFRDMLISTEGRKKLIVEYRGFTAEGIEKVTAECRDFIELITSQEAEKTRNRSSKF